MSLAKHVKNSANAMLDSSIIYIKSLLYGEQESWRLHKLQTRRNCQSFIETSTEVIENHLDEMSRLCPVIRLPSTSRNYEIKDYNSPNLLSNLLSLANEQYFAIMCMPPWIKRDIPGDIFQGYYQALEKLNEQIRKRYPLWPDVNR